MVAWCWSADWLGGQGTTDYILSLTVDSFLGFPFAEINLSLSRHSCKFWRHSRGADGDRGGCKREIKQTITIIWYQCEN